MSKKTRNSSKIKSFYEMSEQLRMNKINKEASEMKQYIDDSLTQKQLDQIANEIAELEKDYEIH